MTEEDRALLTQLSRLNAASTTLSMDLLKRSTSREDHIKLVLLLLDVADRVLKRIAEHPATVQSDGSSPGGPDPNPAEDLAEEPRSSLP